MSARKQMLNREGWLTEVAKQVSPLYRAFGLKPYRVTCGWPCRGGTGGRRRVVGECHGAKSSAGGVFEVFISPVLAEPLEVSGTLCHELAHVAAGIDAKHGGEFLRVCRHVGLTKGRPLSVMPGERLNERLRGIVERLGPYPHSALTGVPRRTKPPTTARLECACGCRVTMSLKWLERCGEPTCGCGEKMERGDA